MSKNHVIAYDDPRVIQIVKESRGRVTYGEAKRRVVQSINAKNGRVTDRRPEEVTVITVPVGQRRVKSQSRLMLEMAADELGIAWDNSWADSALEAHIAAKSAAKGKSGKSLSKLTKAELIAMLQGGEAPRTEARPRQPKKESISKNARQPKPINRHGVPYQTHSSEPCRVVNFRTSGGRSYYTLDGIPLKDVREALSRNGITWRGDLGEWTAAGYLSVNVVSAILNS